MKHLLARRKFWLALAVISTVFFAVVYVSVQQALRRGANSPQNSMAQDVAAGLESGKKPSDLVNGYVDMNQSEAPFVIIYDQFGKVVAGNGYLDGQIPQVPIGVLTAANGHKLHAVTWQPEGKTRIAAVSAQGGSFYVLGGRSLFSVEGDISSFGRWLAAAWILSLAVLVAGSHIARKKFTKQPQPKP